MVFFNKIVGQRSGRLHLLQLHYDRIRLERTNPDRQLALAIHLLEQDDPMRRHQADPNAVDDNFYHGDLAHVKRFSKDCSMEGRESKCPGRPVSGRPGTQ
jgi:hypothetical protein